MKNTKVRNGLGATLAVGLVTLACRGLLGGPSWETEVCYDREYPDRPGMGQAMGIEEGSRRLSDEWTLFPTSFDLEDGRARSAVLVNTENGSHQSLSEGDEVREPTEKGNSVFVDVDSEVVFAGVSCRRDYRDTAPVGSTPGMRR